MKKIYSLFLIIFLAGTICSGQESGMLTGVLHDQLTGEPLFGVKVTAGMQVTRTDEDGIFPALSHILVLKKISRPGG